MGGERGDGEFWGSEDWGVTGNLGSGVLGGHGNRGGVTEFGGSPPALSCARALQWVGFPPPPPQFFGVILGIPNPLHTPSQPLLFPPSPPRDFPSLRRFQGSVPGELRSWGVLRGPERGVPVFPPKFWGPPGAVTADPAPIPGFSFFSPKFCCANKCTTPPPQSPRGFLFGIRWNLGIPKFGGCR